MKTLQQQLAASYDHVSVSVNRAAINQRMAELEANLPDFLIKLHEQIQAVSMVNQKAETLKNNLLTPWLDIKASTDIYLTAVYQKIVDEFVLIHAHMPPTDSRHSKFQHLVAKYDILIATLAFRSHAHHIAKTNPDPGSLLIKLSNQLLTYLLQYLNYREARQYNLLPERSIPINQWQGLASKYRDALEKNAALITEHRSCIYKIIQNCLPQLTKNTLGMGENGQTFFKKKTHMAKYAEQILQCCNQFGT